MVYLHRHSVGVPKQRSVSWDREKLPNWTLVWQIDPHHPCSLIGFMICTDAEKEWNTYVAVPARLKSPFFMMRLSEKPALSPSRLAEAAAAHSRSEAGQARCSLPQLLRIVGLPSLSIKLPAISAMPAKWSVLAEALRVSGAPKALNAVTTASQNGLGNRREARTERRWRDCIKRKKGI